MRKKRSQIMTVGHLIELLEKFDKDRPIVIYPETDYYKEQAKMFIKGVAELDYDNQLALIANKNKLLRAIDYDKVKIVDEENGLLLTAESDNVVDVVV